MRIVIDVDRRNLRRFHRLLRDRLARKFPGAGVALRLVDGEKPLPGLDLLLGLERMIRRPAGEALSDPVPAGTIGEPAAETPDLLLDLSGRAEPSTTPATTLRPLYDGEGSEAAMIGALCEGRGPEIAIENRTTGQIVCKGTPSLEAPEGLSGGIDAVYSRMMMLLGQAIESPEKSAPRGAPARVDAAGLALLRYGARSRAVAIARRLYHLCCHAPHWRIGWRSHLGPGVLERRDLGGPRWNVLGDPGGRFFADPFPMTRDGRSFLFFEDFDHRLGKGAISTVEFGPRGPIGAVIPVLAEPWHLSYPFLIEAEGALWMVPEASRSGRILLYRCIEFPSRWERSATLVEGVEAADSTIFRHEGMFYMMSALREDIGGFSDTLAIHWAPRLSGPWREHAARPALIEATGARPAGAVTRRGGAPWRPVQDCAVGYGRALRLARIDRLDPDHFAQTLSAPIGSGAFWPGGRLHTLNRAGMLEVIDGIAINPKLASLRGLFRDQPTRPEDGRLGEGAPA